MSWIVFLATVAVSGWYISQTSGCNSNLTASPYFGGSGGNAFTDVKYSRYGEITAIRMQCDKYVTTLQLRYGRKWAKKHGWIYSTCTKWFKLGKNINYYLRRGEYLIGAVVSHDKYINTIAFKTNMRTLKKCGCQKGKKTSFVNYKRLKFITGRAGCIVNRLRFYGYKK